MKRPGMRLAATPPPGMRELREIARTMAEDGLLHGRDIQRVGEAVIALLDDDRRFRRIARCAWHHAEACEWAWSEGGSVAHAAATQTRGQLRVALARGTRGVPVTPLVTP